LVQGKEYKYKASDSIDFQNIILPLLKLKTKQSRLLNTWKLLLLGKWYVRKNTHNSNPSFINLTIKLKLRFLFWIFSFLPVSKYLFTNVAKKKLNIVRY